MPRKKTKSARPKKNGRPRKDAPILPLLPDDLEAGGIGRVEIRREVARLLTACTGPGEVVAGIVRKFRIAERQGWRYLAAVREEWTALEKEERPHQRAQLVRVQQDAIIGARKDRKWLAVNGGVKNLLELYGLKATTKVEVGPGGMDALLEAIKTSPAARDAEIEALEAKEREGAAGGAVPG
jgi:hypothetical protein